MADELRLFREALEKTSSTLDGGAALASMDGWLDLTVTCQKSGALVVEGHPPIGPVPATRWGSRRPISTSLT